MKIIYLKRFHKDLEEIKGSGIGQKIAEIIGIVKVTDKISDIKNLKKLSVYHNAYRIKVDDYRIEIFITSNVVTFARIKHRKDIYRVFP